MAGVEYKATFTTSDALGLVSFGTTSTLPTGVTLSSAGVLAGTPTKTGTFPLTVTATDLWSGCTGSQDFTLTINASNPVPTLSSLSPASATSGGPGFTLTVNGTGFINGSAVRWNGTARPTTFDSSTQLRAVISTGDIASAGTPSVTVFTPEPGGGTSAPRLFQISAPPTMALDKTALRFAAVTNGTTFVSQTAAQIVRLTQTRHGDRDVDGDVEPTLAAGEPRVGEWVGQSVHQCRVGRRVDGGQHGHRDDHPDGDGRVEHGGPDRRLAQPGSERDVDESVRRRRHAARQHHRRNGGRSRLRAGRSTMSR